MPADSVVCNDVTLVVGTDVVPSSDEPTTTLELELGGHDVVYVITVPEIVVVTVLKV